MLPVGITDKHLQAERGPELVPLASFPSPAVISDNKLPRFSLSVFF